jgi:WD40 repeat protein
MTRRILAAATAVACLAFAACSDKKTSQGSGKTADSPDPGVVLFVPADYRPAQTGDRSSDPVTVPMASVVIRDKADVSSRVDGTIWWVGTEFDAANSPALKATDKFTHPRDKKVYRRLMPGDIVKKDQVIALLDDEQAFVEHRGALAKSKAAQDEAAAYVETVKNLAKIVEAEAAGLRTGAVPQQEYYSQLATEARYRADLTNRQGQVQIAAVDLDKAKYVLDKHTLRAPFDGEVQQVLKHEGEGVKGQEPVIVLHEFGTLRAIGNLPKEYMNVVSRGDEVTIEVPRDVPPGTIFDQHTTNKPISAVAVAVVGGKPVIVSAAEDGWVYAWDRDLKVIGSWRQQAGVRSLAVTRPGIDPVFVLVGGIDGTAKLYNLGLPGASPREFEGRHDGGVSAAAFSPDGRYCVTADERNIYMYEVSSGKRMYTFPAREHHSPITALHFTPQCRVVSAGKEPSIRVWIVGKEGAKVEHRIDTRSGDVAMPGVTDDGSRLLLDADKSHLDVIHLKDLRKERPLVTAGESIRFNTFTAWSPELDKKADNRLVATTGGVEGVVQLWRAPTGETRGAEVSRMVTRGSAAATCAAFSPLAENGFLVVGTRKGDVHLWPLPSDTDVREELTKAKVTHVEPLIESSGRTVNVLVDFENPKTSANKYLLRPGSAVTLVIRPNK